MNNRIKPVLPAVLFAGAALAAGSASMHAPAAEADESPPRAASFTADEPTPSAEKATTPAGLESGAGGLAGNLYFTDEHGNPRNPTAAELITAGEAFEQDLKRLAGRHYGKLNVRTAPGGAVAATVATSQLVFLTATVNEDGTVTISHSVLDEDGNPVVEPAALPEK